MFKTLYIVLLFLFSITIFAQQDGPRPYTVFLKKGTLLTRLSDKTKFILPRGIYAQVLELNPKRRDLFYIYDQAGKPIYEMTSEGMIEIADDIALLPKVDAEKSWPAKSTLKAMDQSALFESQLNMNFENMNLSAFNDIYSDEIKYVIAPRYEFRTLYDSELPFSFGLDFNYQTAYWKNDFEEVKISILSLGPQFKYQFYRHDSFNAHLLLSAELAPIYQGRTAQFSDDYSAQIYDLGIEGQWQGPIGKVLLGSHFRHHQVALSRTDRVNVQETPKEFSVNSLGITVGYKIDWEL